MFEPENEAILQKFLGLHEAISKSFDKISPEVIQMSDKVCSQILKEDLAANCPDVSLYVVLTEYLEPAPSKKITTNDYRVLATSLIEAAQIVQKSIQDAGNETITDVRKASHITGLPENKFKVIKV